MKFVERTPTIYSKRHREQGPAQLKDAVTDQDPRLDVFYSIDEAVPRLGKRPHTAAGLERRKRSSSKLCTGTTEAQEPTRSAHLQVAGITLEYKDGLDTFCFPSPSPGLSPTPRSATYNYLPASAQMSPRGPHGYDSPRIGIAIGSPSKAPPNWGRSHTADQISRRMPQPTRLAPDPPTKGSNAGSEPVVSKGRKASWRTLFRWASSQPTPTKQATPPTQGQTETKTEAKTEERYAGLNPAMYSLRAGKWEQHDPVSPIESTAKANDKQQQRLLRKPSRAQQQREVNWSPLPEPESPSFKTTLRSKIRRLSHSTGNKTPSPRLALPRLQSSPKNLKTSDGPRHDSMALFACNEAMDALLVPRTPRLDVPIERAEFDRYSVMFAKQLANDGKMSLYERRQSRLQRTKSDKRSTCPGSSADELRVLTELTGAKQQSTTSPHLSRPLSIKVDGRKVKGMTAESSTMASAARPAHVKRSNTAPLASSSPFNTPFSQRKQTNESSPESPGSACFSENLVSTPTTFTTCTDKGSIQLSNGPVEPAEPAWDMITPKVVQHESLPITDMGSGSGNVSSRERRSEPYPRVKSPEDLERQMVQVSVARQVSVSRARSRVQDAVATSSFKQPLRPRVVELSGNRKSHVGVVQNVNDDTLSTKSRPTSEAVGELGEEPRPAVPAIEVSND